MGTTDAAERGERNIAFFSRKGGERFKSRKNMSRTDNNDTAMNNPRNPIRISIVVPVYNRPDETDALLSSIAAQKENGLDYQVVIVEDGSSVTSQQVCEKWSDKIPVRYFYTENSGPGDSRNYGMERAEGDYFVILDSDVLLPEHYFATLERILSRTNVPDAFAGPDCAHSSFTDVQKAINYAMTSFLTTGGLRGGSKANLSGRRQLRSFNMVVSARAFRIAGGFAHQRVGEDIEYTQRLWRNDLLTAWYPELYVYHKRRDTLGQFFRQTMAFGRARPILNRMFPGTARLTYLFPSFFLVFMVISLLGGLLSPVVAAPLGVYLAAILVSSWAMNRSFSVGVLSVAAAVVQFTGYGWGFIYTNFRMLYLDDVDKVFPYMFKH